MSRSYRLYHKMCLRTIVDGNVYHTAITNVVQYSSNTYTKYISFEIILIIS